MLADPFPERSTETFPQSFALRDFVHRRGCQAFRTARKVATWKADGATEVHAMKLESLPDVLAGDPLLLTPAEAAAVLRIGRSTVFALIKSGELHPVRIGRACRLPRAELERFVGRLVGEAASSPRS